MSSASVPPPATSLTAQRAHDPDNWLKVASWILIAFSIAQVVVFSFGRDQGIYALVADGMLQGEMPYRDLWDFKPPGIFFVYAIAQAVFGQSMVAIRVLEGIFMVASAWASRSIGEHLFQSKTAGLLGGAIACMVHAQLEFWHTGQPETFAGSLTILALALTLKTTPPSRRWIQWAVVGALFGFCFLLKPPLGGGALACAIWAGITTKDRRQPLLRYLLPVLVMALGSAIPILLCLLWFGANDALEALKWTLGDFAPGYTALSWHDKSPIGLLYHALSESLFDYSSLLTSGFLLLLALHGRPATEKRGATLIFSILSFQLIGIAIQGKFFQYHFAASVPLLSLLAGQGYYKLFRRWAIGSLSGSLAFAALFSAMTFLSRPVNDVPGSPFQRMRARMLHLFTGGKALSRAELDRHLHYVSDYNLDADRLVNAALTKRLKPGDPLYIWGFEPVIYWLGNHQPASRFIYNVPQRARWERDKSRQLL
ncbi:MAG: glycosyltransferase family 39 protein, partial [Polyangiaceae bacterium]|nr:glycosyltransferase family 39 protein [Polyangiaceae bacterium]